MTQILSRRERVLQDLKMLGLDGPKRSLGQNFLISDHVIDKILFAVRAEPFDDLIEIGPGLGALTDDLLKLVEQGEHRLTLIELDRGFAQAWRVRTETLQAQVKVIEDDAPKIDWRTLGTRDGALLVSNLPYQISSSVVIERSLQPTGINRMILMFQREVASRIAARPATADYGMLTVIAQTFWETQTVCEAGPRDFFPPPDVASRVLQFRRKSQPWIESGHGTAPEFLSFVKAAYAQRRKLLVRNLQKSRFGGQANLVERVRAWLEGSGFSATARAEELDPASLLGLYLKMEEAEKDRRRGDHE